MYIHIYVYTHLITVYIYINIISHLNISYSLCMLMYDIHPMQADSSIFQPSKVSILVFMNAILIGAQTDYAAQHGGASGLTQIWQMAAG